MIPRAWIVEWQALGDTPAGAARYTQRHQARGFYIMRKAAGFSVTLRAVFD